MLDGLHVTDGAVHPVDDSRSPWKAGSEPPWSGHGCDDDRVLHENVRAHHVPVSHGNESQLSRPAAYGYGVFRLA